MSPSEVSNLHDAGEVDLNLLDVGAGHGTLFDFDLNRSNDEIVEIMKKGCRGQRQAMAQRSELKSQCH